MFVLMIMIVMSLVGTKSKRASFVCCASESSTPWVVELFYLFYFISFAKENKTFNVTKLNKGVDRDTATAEANYSGPG